MPERFQTPRCGPGKIQVLRRPRTQPRGDLATVHLHHAALGVEDWDHQGAVQVLVPALAEDPEPLQRLA